VIDPQWSDLYIAEKQRDLIQEAERERLIALLPHQPSVARHLVAQACRGMAAWLEGPKQYIRTPESRQTDLVGHSAGL
jgi:hypothetical protein